MNGRRNYRGFTLTELMIVLVIVGVLAAMAINQFYGPRNKALERDATTNLKLIAAAEKIYRMELLKFINGSDAVALNENLSLMLPEADAKWNYKVEGASTSGFTAKAARSDGTTGTLCFNESSDEPYPCSW